jgi:16S rRNA A1518/A1519 N6-dimethyltransferase RsmA/KsgA/DIM1 with predicted DNA glycosylase/AP lyase activity
VSVTNEDAFFKFVREAFKYKRKTLKNNLKNYPLEQIEAVLQMWGNDLMIRAEGLSIEQLAAIYNNISREKP